MPKLADYCPLPRGLISKRVGRTLAALGAVLVACSWVDKVIAGTIVSAAYAPSPVISEPDTQFVQAITDAPNATDIWSPQPISPGVFAQNNIINDNAWQTAGAIDLVFTVSNSGGTTRYQEGPNATNFTSNYITGYQWELGFSSGADFVRSDAGGSLTFHLTPDEQAAYSSFYTTNNMPWGIPQTAQDDSLQFSMSSFTQFNPPGVTGQASGVEVGGIQYIVQVPDNLNQFNPDGLNQFTIRITAISALSVPEPSSYQLFAVSAVALAFAGIKRRR